MWGSKLSVVLVLAATDVDLLVTMVLTRLLYIKLLGDLLARLLLYAVESALALASRTPEGGGRTCATNTRLQNAERARRNTCDVLKVA